MPLMHMRRTLTLAIGALLLAAPLSSCGFDLATDRIYTPAAGTNNRDASVDVLGAAIVSAESGSGTFIATFVNNDLEEEATVDGLTPAADADATVGDFAPITVPPNGLVNLAADDQGGVPVTGDGVNAGGVLSMTVQLSGGQVVELDVPVVTNCGEFEGIDGTGGDCEIAEPEGGAH
jgi:hypothetical protein